MKNMTRAQRRRQAKIRKMLLSLSLVLVISMAAVGGTVAWLTATSSEVTNTFTVGDINIKLQEHDYDPDTNELDKDVDPVQENDDYKIIPGMNLPKDPYVYVEKGSEASWLFVKITKANWPATGLSYEIADGWTELEDGVYFRKVAATSETANSDDMYILKDDQVVVSNQLTKTDLKNIKDAGSPKLTFKAFAVQQEGFTSKATDALNAADAWDAIPDADKN